MYVSGDVHTSWYVQSSLPNRPVVGVGKEEEEEVEKDPWNAVAVVGLRVYYRVDLDAMKREEEVVKVRVVRPNYFAMSEDEQEETASKEKEDDEMDETKVLDLDDSAKDATLQKKEKEHIIEEIKGKEKIGDEGEEASAQEEKKEPVLLTRNPG